MSYRSVFSLISVMGICLGLLLWVNSQVEASFSGRVGFSGNPATNAGNTCTVCHAVGAPLPTVSLTGPATVNAGTVSTYTLTIAGGPAQVAGLNVSVAGNEGVLAPINAETQIIAQELTHTSPKPFVAGMAVFTFTWTAPNSNGNVVMYAAANSANNLGNLSGDGINTTSLNIQVQNGPAPTPTPTPVTPSTGIQFSLIADGFSQPVDITHAGDTRLFVVEKPGRIAIISNGAVLPTPFLDISGQVGGGTQEEGLLGLAFHPNYASNGYFYVYYTVYGPRRSRVSRFTVSSDPNVADPASELILLEFAQPFDNHNGGDLVFGPDGYLYIASGDGGSGGDPNGNGQNSQVLLGKLLRLDVDTPPGPDTGPDCSLLASNNYRIPPDNLYTDGTGGAGCDEIWATGLRNPWRISFDRDTGDLWIADVGQGEWEEINVVPANGSTNRNYGWRCYEGDVPFNLSGCGPAGNYVFPVHTYDHGSGRCSVTGGFVYRGPQYPELEGNYFLADFCTNEFWSLSGSLSNPTVQLVMSNAASPVTNPTTFGESNLGELVVADFNGQVWRLRGFVPVAITTATVAVTTGGNVAGIAAAIIILIVVSGWLKYRANQV